MAALLLFAFSLLAWTMDVVVLRTGCRIGRVDPPPIGRSITLVWSARFVGFCAGWIVTLGVLLGGSLFAPGATSSLFPDVPRLYVVGSIGVVILNVRCSALLYRDVIERMSFLQALLISVSQVAIGGALGIAFMFPARLMT